MCIACAASFECTTIVRDRGSLAFQARSPVQRQGMTVASIGRMPAEQPLVRIAAQKILCPIDFSAGSDHALRVAVRLAAHHGAELVIAHVWYAGEDAFAAHAVAAGLVEEIIDEEERGLAAVVRDANALGAARVSSQLLMGGYRCRSRSALRPAARGQRFSGCSTRGATSISSSWAAAAGPGSAARCSARSPRRSCGTRRAPCSSRGDATMLSADVT